MPESEANIILQHWREPFHRERCPEADLYGRSVSTFCGDEIDLYLFVEGGVIQDAFFDGDACTICLGVASLTTQHIVGLTVEEAYWITADEIFQLVTDFKIPKSRRDCALVTLRALWKALS